MIEKKIIFIMNATKSSRQAKYNFQDQNFGGFWNGLERSRAKRRGKLVDLRNIYVSNRTEGYASKLREVCCYQLCPSSCKEVQFTKTWLQSHHKWRRGSQLGQRTFIFNSDVAFKLFRSSEFVGTNKAKEPFRIMSIAYKKYLLGM